MTLCVSFAGVHAQTRAPVAIKLQRADHPSPKLPTEAEVYRSLAGAEGFARMHWFGQAHGHLALVMDRLGPCLKSRQADAGPLGRRELRSVSGQLLDRLELMHDRHWLHLDVKPANFLYPATPTAAAAGHASDAAEIPVAQLRCIDFGLSRRWFDPASGEAVPSAPRRGTVGTVRFASIANQQAQALGRRDDLESLAFTLVQLHHGELPWSHVQAPTKQERFRLMLACKLRVSVGELCTGLPALAEFVQAVRTLRPEERPDYDALRELLRTL